MTLKRLLPVVLVAWSMAACTGSPGAGEPATPSTSQAASSPAWLVEIEQPTEVFPADEVLLVSVRGVLSGVDAGSGEILWAHTSDDSTVCMKAQSGDPGRGVVAIGQKGSTIAAVWGALEEAGVLLRSS